MAWASVLVLCLGVAAGTDALHALHRHFHGTVPQHARQSLFTLGRRQVRAWLYHAPIARLRWTLPGLAAPTWSTEWTTAQARLLIFAPCP